MDSPVREFAPDSHYKANTLYTDMVVSNMLSLMNLAIARRIKPEIAEFVKDCYSRVIFKKDIRALSRADARKINQLALTQNPFNIASKRR